MKKLLIIAAVFSATAASAEVITLPNGRTYDPNVKVARPVHPTNKIEDEINAKIKAGELNKNVGPKVVPESKTAPVARRPEAPVPHAK